MSQPIIRQYQQADFEQLESIYNRCKPLELAGEPEQFQIQPLTEDKLRYDLIFSSNIYVCCQQEKLVGFVTIKEQQIGWLYVDPDHHKQGLGQKLLSFIIEQYPGDLFLNIVPSNHSALNLYLKNHFVKESSLTIPVSGKSVSVDRMKRAK